MDILFLTGCINPKGMTYTALNNPEERKRQYTEAIRWYLDNTQLKILFVENSGCDISSMYNSEILSGRIEVLTYEGNDYDRSLGKGYGEAKILEYGIRNSRLLYKNPCAIIKITGRLICKNISTVLKYSKKQSTVYANIGLDDWGGNIAVSQVVKAPMSFWQVFFLSKSNDINDSKRVHFEHVLYNSINEWKLSSGRYREFIIEPELIGMSGSTGASIPRKNLNSTLRYYLNYILHRYFHYYGYLNPFYKGKQR